MIINGDGGYGLYRRASGSSRLAWSKGQWPPSAISVFIAWTEWTLAVALLWWQHYKYCYCLSNALYSNIGQNIKSVAPISGLRSPARVWKTSNGHNSATCHPIDFVFGSKVGFSGTADRTAPFPVGWNPRWRPVAILKKKLQMAISQQCIIVLVLGWARIALFNLTAHELEALERVCVRLNMYLIIIIIIHMPVLLTTVVVSLHNIQGGYWCCCCYYYY